MIGRIKRHAEKLAMAKGARDVLRGQLKNIIRDRKSLTQDLETTTEAKALVQVVAKNTQKKIEYHISNLVTSTLEGIFPEPWEFQLKFEERRGKTEADLIFIKDGNPTDDILFAGGGGVADVASFILGIALYNIHPTRPLILRDESFKFLHSIEFQEKASKLIKKITEMFNIQIILISDQPRLYNEADLVLNVGIKDGVSYIMEGSQPIIKPLKRRKIS